MLRLASRLQTLRWLRGRCKRAGADGRRGPVNRCQVFAPLANRLGIWEIKWELEDLAFRFLEPDTYHALVRAPARAQASVNVSCACIEELRTTLASRPAAR